MPVERSVTHASTSNIGNNAALTLVEEDITAGDPHLLEQSVGRDPQASEIPGFGQSVSGVQGSIAVLLIVC